MHEAKNMGFLQNKDILKERINIRVDNKIIIECSWYIESSLDTDKKRRWRAKKKDQHHRTQVSLRHLLVEQIAHNLF
ncbi:unnamed protein product [Rotaria socialis]|uniref:Uncharacterized protein n=1 Tax=Rotaria socialis TaxID=392032 RepID=A0A818PCP3_9BILA|nr:unnamed protein product [Rotaria socialis]CAF3394387.1 unnamed protein product [Rotaria socialis]CAF3400918.1 unnamed protein product [Rotaria socialis]CAF3619026.1 unnamed protein product [Rotaria socialis]